MDGLIDTTKETLNVTEDKQYNRQPGPNFESKIMNYFLRSKENAATCSFLSMNDDVYHESDGDETDENKLIDDMESDDDTVDEEPEINEPEDTICGSIMEWDVKSITDRHSCSCMGVQPTDTGHRS